MQNPRKRTGRLAEAGPPGTWRWRQVNLRLCSVFVFFFFFFGDRVFLFGPSSLDQAGLELTEICPLLTPECQDCGCMPPFEADASRPQWP